MNDVLEFAKSVGGIGSILIFVLFGAYWIFKPLIDDWRALVRDLVKDQKDARELFAREIGEMRQERSASQLAQQHEMAAVSNALERMSDSLQEAMNGRHIAENAPAERGKDRSGFRSRPAST